MPSPADCDTLQAIFAGVQAAMDDADREWGAGRLELLVDDAWRAKLYAQKRKWSEAIQAAWNAEMVTRDQLAAVEEHAGGMKRAFAKLGELATEAGHRPIAPWAWDVQLSDGRMVAFVQTDAEAGKVAQDSRYVAVWTPREIASLIEAIPEVLQSIKQAWKGATVLPPAACGPFDVRRGDPIPFPDAPDAERAA